MQYLLVTNDTSSAIESGIQCKMPEKGCSRKNGMLHDNDVLEKGEWDTTGRGY